MKNRLREYMMKVIKLTKIGDKAQRSIEMTQERLRTYYPL